MPRGGLSSDPTVAKRQLAALAEGRRIARERREAGLPTKRTESRQTAPADTGDHRQTGKVVRGSYERDAGDGGRSRAKRKPERQEQAPANDGPTLGRLDRVYARLLGVELDA